MTSWGTLHKSHEEGMAMDPLFDDTDTHECG